MLCVSHVCHAVTCCVKMGVVLRRAWSKSQWTVLTGYLTTSTNVRRYQTHYTPQMTIFLSERQRTVHCACNTVQLLQRSRLIQHFSENRLSCFLVLPGGVEAKFIWGGILKHLLIACFIGNISAKNISKSVHVYQSYSKPKVGCCFWDTV